METELDVANAKIDRFATACAQAETDIVSLTGGVCGCNNTPPYCTLCVLRKAQGK